MATAMYPWHDGIIGKMLQGNPRLLWWFTRLNSLVRKLYRWRLATIFGLGFAICLLTVKGRKTGLPRHVPLEYHFYHTGVMTLLSSRGKQAQWAKNILADDRVHVDLGFKQFDAKAKIIDDAHVVFEHLLWYIRKVPWLARSFLGYNVWKPRHRIWDVTAEGKIVPGPGYAAIMALAERLIVVQLYPLA
ncbi:MAG: nitroreductase family deazaflavin-dependent oxidoreductase [Candidatus Ranarchaeia archaeon]